MFIRGEESRDDSDVSGSAAVVSDQDDMMISGHMSAAAPPQELE